MQWNRHVNWEAIKWLHIILWENRIKFFDGDSRSHENNDVELINEALKGMYNLPITAFIKATYYNTEKLFPTIKKLQATILASGQVYIEKCKNFIKTRDM